jgi:RHS repeat-associated protein
MLTRAARMMTLMTRLTCALTAALLLLPAPARAQAEEVVYYHTDAIGSVRAITDATGAVIARYDFLPFGEALSSTVPETRQFAGKERDAETGLDYFGARHHMSATGRFTTVDPVSTTHENLIDPQRWNRYSYARNNPVRFTDPDGRTIDVVADVAFIAYDLFDMARSLVRGQGVGRTQVAALGADVLAAAIPFATGGGIAVRAAAHGDNVVVAARASGPYVRPSGATTRAQRAAVQGKPCVDCGAVTGRQVADHKTPLVKEHYETGSIDKTRMRDPIAVQPHCPTCSSKQGAELSRYSREQRRLLNEPK